MGTGSEAGSWYRQMFEVTSTAIFVYTLDGKLVDINPAACALHGWPREVMLQKSPQDFIAPESIEVFDAFRDALSRGEEYRGLAQGLKADGSRVDVEVYGVGIELDGESFAFSSLTDVTEKMRLRARATEMDRMDALGRLASGVAHDFNNMLTIMMGCADLGRITDSVEEKNAAFRDILATSERARELTLQLLSFSSNRAIRSCNVDVAAIVNDLIPLLRRTMPEGIELRAELPTKPCFIAGEPAPLEQVVMNLVLNARDAMPDGGRILIRLKTREIDETSQLDVATGTYLELSVEDDGAGMPPDIRSRIFEPFFSTKGDLGTGLGLATAYGIVQQHQGDIVVYSEVGHGTIFRVFLPLLREALATETAVVVPQWQGTPLDATIVVVDNEPMVRGYVVRALRGLGAVAEAADNVEASALVDRLKPSLPVTDVVMPGMSGTELYARLRIEHPALKVLYLSGYSADYLSRGGLLDDGIEVLSKPFNTQELAVAVHRALQDSGGTSDRRAS
ncbi:MAG: PAS domain S-box protein, partial [Nannocystaceae bacterium]|nr:PAS domain S-box protein [Nannocystaceae bacterium]